MGAEQREQEQNRKPAPTKKLLRKEISVQVVRFFFQNPIVKWVIETSSVTASVNLIVCARHAPFQVTLAIGCNSHGAEARRISNMCVEVFQISVRLSRWKSVFLSVLTLLTCPGFPENCVR